MLPSPSAPGQAVPDERLVVPDALSFVSQSVGFGLNVACQEAATKRHCSFAATRTADAGVKWTRVGDARDVALDAGDAEPRVTFADEQHGWIYGPGLIETADGGVTWMPRPIAPRVPTVAARGNAVWATAVECSDDGCDVHVFRQTVGDATWHRRLTPVHSIGRSEAILTLVDPNHAFVLVVSEDPGRTVLLEVESYGDPRRAETFVGPGRAHRLPCDDPARVAADTRRVWLACTDPVGSSEQPTRLFTSGDSGANWRLVADTGNASGRKRIGNIPAGGMLGDLVALDAETLLMSRNAIHHPAPNTEALISRSATAGETWYTTMPNQDDALTLIFIDGQLGWALGPNSLFRTIDGGRTWIRTAHR
ncbi:MAG TPA: hypothetical protein VGB64_15220 [Actinomycetota bacterium]